MVAMVHKYERPMPELPVDWEEIGRLVREQTLASMAAEIESLVSLLGPTDSDFAPWGGGPQS